MIYAVSAEYKEGDCGIVFNLWQAGIPITIFGILIPIYVSCHWAQKKFYVIQGHNLAKDV